MDEKVDEKKPPLTFEERMAEKRAAEGQDDQKRIENDRLAYLKRTGRSQMKP